MISDRTINIFLVNATEWQRGMLAVVEASGELCKTSIEENTQVTQI